MPHPSTVNALEIINWS